MNKNIKLTLVAVVLYTIGLVTACMSGLWLLVTIVSLVSAAYIINYKVR